MDLVLSFPDEHQRILRALHDSLDRESDAQRLLRRMKESLVGTALRLQVAVKTVQDDEMTMQQLRRELEDMRKEAKSAAAAHEDAGKYIADLRLEVSGLKRRLNQLESQQRESRALQASLRPGSSSAGVGEYNDNARAPPGIACDQAVDGMFNKHKRLDGGFARDARKAIMASLEDDTVDFSSADTGDMTEIAMAIEEARTQLRSAERIAGSVIGSGAGVGIRESPAGLADHEPVLHTNFPPNMSAEQLSQTNLHFQSLYKRGVASQLNAPVDDFELEQFASNPGGATQGDVTAFQHWKMKNFLWSPDTPEASKHFDKWAVERLTDNALKDSLSPKKLAKKNTSGGTGAGLLALSRSVDAMNIGVVSTGRPNTGKKTNSNGLARLQTPVLSNITKVNQVRLSKARVGDPPVIGPLGLPLSGPYAVPMDTNANLPIYYEPGSRLKTAIGEIAPSSTVPGAGDPWIEEPLSRDDKKLESSVSEKPGFPAKLSIKEQKAKNLADMIAAKKAAQAAYDEERRRQQEIMAEMALANKPAPESELTEVTV